MTKTADRLARLALFTAVAIVLYGAAREFHAIAWGTGHWLGEFSAKWGIAFALFCIANAALLVYLGRILWAFAGRPRQQHADRLSTWIRWTLGAVLLLLPILLLQYTPWGVVFDGPFIRLELWAAAVALAYAALRFRRDDSGHLATVMALVIAAGTLMLVAAALTEVTDYPFSLGWSEGNRLWDYSLLFGKDLYAFDAGQEPVAYLDFGRQLLGGLPFVLPRVSIFGARLWLGLLSVLAPLVLGMVTFLPERGARAAGWQFAGLGGMAFLSQGPIHSPLLVSAIVVAAAWRLRLLWATPLLFVAGYFAEISRFTWMFAPAMWIVMLELGAAQVKNGRIDGTTWRRVTLLTVAGLLGSAAAYLGVLSSGPASTGSSASVSTTQALLWYRLLPNATYGEGVALGLLKAALPLSLAVWWVGRNRWRPTPLQTLVLATGLVASLVVGLVVSTKIGGGGDLHNLDMFLVGLLFTAGIAWRRSSERIRKAVDRAPLWVAALLIPALMIPYYGPLRSLRPLEFAQHASWLRTLADLERERDLNSLPEDAIVSASLDQLRTAVSEAKYRGDVLLMDQRQLLTFGFLQDVKLFSDYEKKRLMDEALSGNATYFGAFYADLAAKRFPLIVSSLLRTPIKDSDYGFGEENNAWVDWVARPVLCYYEEQDTLNEVKVELLVPKVGQVDCQHFLPTSRP